MSKTPCFKQSSNKENLFIQIASKKSHSLQKKPLKSDTYKYADEHYDDLIQKIEQLDHENHKLRELLKKSHYLQFKFVDVSKSDCDFSSFSEIKNKSLDLSLDEFKTRNNDLFSAKKVQTPRQSLAAKQIGIQRQRNSLIHSYTQELIQEQTSYDYQLPEEIQENCMYEIYKELLLNVVNKDMKIFRYMDQVIQQELKQNFHSNYSNYEKQSAFLSDLIQLLTNMQNYCCGDHPDNHFIMRSYRNLKNLIHQITKMFEKMKLFMIPLNNLEIDIQERIAEIDRLQEQTQIANSNLQEAVKIIEQLTEENHQLTKQNKQYQDFFTQISYELQINQESSQLKQDLDEIMQRCIDGIIKLSDNSKSPPIQIDCDNDLIMRLQKISDRYDQLKEKNNRNKEKFRTYLKKVQSSLGVQYFQQQTIEEQIQRICEAINSLNSKINS